MVPNPLSNGLLWAAAAAFIVVRQFMPRTVGATTMVALPLVIGFLGLQALAAAAPRGPGCSRAPS